MTTAMFCEIEPFCRRVLAKHWPGVPIHDDIRTLDRLVVEAQAGAVDLVCGGFPCTDLSFAGRGAGLSGERSGLWFEYLRVIEEITPRWVVIENVPALRSRGLDTVLGGLAALGYDAEWHCLPASAVGATQRRERIWILANAYNTRLEGPIWAGKPAASGPERQAARGEPLRSACGYWPPGPRAVDNIPRMADGAANRMDRLRGLGNAVVPQIPELIGRAIMNAERGSAHHAHPQLQPKNTARDGS